MQGKRRCKVRRAHILLAREASQHCLQQAYTSVVRTMWRFRVSVWYLSEQGAVCGHLRFDLGSISRAFSALFQPASVACNIDISDVKSHLTFCSSFMLHQLALVDAGAEAIQHVLSCRIPSPPHLLPPPPPPKASNARAPASATYETPDPAAPASARLSGYSPSV